MPAFQINDAEWAALVEEPGDVFLLYCSIRRFMDYATGIAGIKRRISEQMLREVLYVAPVAGRHSPPAVTRQKVRTILSRLEALGALIPVGPMVYQFPLAAWDGLSKTGTTKEQPKEQPREQPISNQPQASNGEPFSDETGAGATAGESDSPEGNNLPPVSGFLPTSRHPANPPERFPMHDNWEPSAKGWKATALRNGLGATPVSPELLMEFRSYWINRPDKYQSQGQWEHELAQKLQREVRNAQRPGFARAEANQDRATGQRPVGKRSLSAVERVEHAIEQQRANRAKACGAAAPGADGKAVGDDGGNLRPPLDGEFWREPEA